MVSIHKISFVTHQKLVNLPSHDGQKSCGRKLRDNFVACLTLA